MLSRNVPPSQQGELQGAITGIMSLTAIIGPVLHTFIFAWFSGGGHLSFPGAAFLGAALLTLAALATAVRASR